MLHNIYALFPKKQLKKGHILKVETAPKTLEKAKFQNWSRIAPRSLVRHKNRFLPWSSGKFPLNHKKIYGVTI